MEVDNLSNSFMDIIKDLTSPKSSRLATPTFRTPLSMSVPWAAEDTQVALPSFMCSSFLSLFLKKKKERKNAMLV